MIYKPQGAGLSPTANNMARGHMSLTKKNNKLQFDRQRATRSIGRIAIQIDKQIQLSPSPQKNLRNVRSVFRGSKNSLNPQEVQSPVKNMYFNPFKSPSNEREGLRAEDKQPSFGDKISPMKSQVLLSHTFNGINPVMAADSSMETQKREISNITQVKSYQEYRQPPVQDSDLQQFLNHLEPTTSFSQSHHETRRKTDKRPAPSEQADHAIAVDRSHHERSNHDLNISDRKQSKIKEVQHGERPRAMEIPATNLHHSGNFLQDELFGAQDNASAGSFVMVNASETKGKLQGAENIEDDGSQLNQSFGMDSLRQINSKVQNQKHLNNYVEFEEDVLSPQPRIPAEQEPYQYKPKSPVKGANQQARKGSMLLHHQTPQLKLLGQNLVESNRDKQLSNRRLSHQNHSPFEYKTASQPHFKKSPLRQQQHQLQEHVMHQASGSPVKIGMASQKASPVKTSSIANHRKSMTQMGQPAFDMVSHPQRNEAMKKNKLFFASKPAVREKQPSKQQLFRRVPDSQYSPLRQAAESNYSTQARNPSKTRKSPLSLLNKKQSLVLANHQMLQSSHTPQAQNKNLKQSSSGYNLNNHLDQAANLSPMGNSSNPQLNKFSQEALQAVATSQQHKKPKKDGNNQDELFCSFTEDQNFTKFSSSTQPFPMGFSSKNLEEIESYQQSNQFDFSQQNNMDEPIFSSFSLHPPNTSAVQPPAAPQGKPEEEGSSIKEVGLEISSKVMTFFRSISQIKTPQDTELKVTNITHQRSPSPGVREDGRVSAQFGTHSQPDIQQDKAFNSTLPSNTPWNQSQYDLPQREPLDRPLFGSSQKQRQPYQPMQYPSLRSKRGSQLSLLSNQSRVQPSQDGALTSNKAAEMYTELTDFEKVEIQEYPMVYTIGTVRRQNQYSVADKEGQYIIQVGEQLAYRYEVIRIIDQGAFGQVLQCRDRKEGGRIVAAKIGKNKKFDIDNANVEIRILKKLKVPLEEDNEGYNRLVEFIDSFKFRNHVVIVFELLNMNLYKFQKMNRRAGRSSLHPHLLKQVSKQICQGLKFMRNKGIIHCDMKPENILFTDERFDHVKIIDFGASCEDFTTGFFYVQSRYYRAPEIVLGIEYDHAVDMWSFGCILYEMLMSTPLFPAKDENELLEFFIVTVGEVPTYMLQEAKKFKQFFRTDRQGNPTLIRSKVSSLEENLKARSHPISELLRGKAEHQMIDFISKCLVLEPEDRMTPQAALHHAWLVEV